MRRRARRGRVPLLLHGLSACATSPSAFAGSPAAPPPRVENVPQLFTVGKSENKNRVAYGMKLDERCAPIGDGPVYAYWRMLEKGASVTEPLLPREEPAYGIQRQRVEGGVTKILLRAVPDREIWIEPKVVDGRCTATAWTRIAGTRAALYDIFVQLRWPFGVDHLRVRGRTAQGALVDEILEPP